MPSRHLYTSVADNEKRFFDEYYLHHAYNPIAWNLRFEREKQALIRIIQANRHDLGNVLSLGCGDGQFEI